MDEQTADFFAPSQPSDAPPDVPPSDSGAYAPMDSGGYENIGDVDFANAPSDAPPPLGSDSGEMQHQAPAVLVLDDGSAAAPPPPAGGEDTGGGLMDFAAPVPADGDTILAPPPPDMMGGGDDLMAPPPDSGDMMGLPAPGGDAPMGGALIEPEKSNEPSPMAKFNQEWQVILRERKDAENALKAEHVEKGRADLDAFQAERERKREARMAKNRSDEQQKLEDLEADLENDNSWQRVVKMVELQQDTVEGAQDKKRMIDVLVLMKNDAERAVALA